MNLISAWQTDMEKIRKRILIVGELIRDRSTFVELSHQSIEGVPSYKKIRSQLNGGGSANLAKHCIRLGAEKVFLMHFSTPYSFGGDELSPQESLKVTQSLPAYSDCDIEKHRIYLHDSFKSHHSDDDLIMKINSIRENYNFANIEIELEKCFKARFDIVLILDSGHGLFTDKMAESVFLLAKNKNVPIWVDCQISNVSNAETRLKRWQNADILFLNDKERMILGDKVNVKNYHHKMGKYGSIVVNGNDVRSYEGYSAAVVDTLGAGDAYMAAMAIFDNPKFANFWAAKTCELPGTFLPSENLIGFF